MSGLVLTLNLPARVRTRLDAEAKRLGRTPEQLAEEAIAARLKPSTRSRGGSLFERTRDLCGSLRGGPTDLARNKDHLQGYGALNR